MKSILLETKAMLYYCMLGKATSSIYIYVACLSVCLYPINVKMTEFMWDLT